MHKISLSKSMEFSTLAQNTLIREQKSTSPPWMSHEKGYKLNGERSSIGNSRRSRMGGVIRDTKGNWIEGYIWKIHVANNIKAKLRTLLQGLQMVLKRGLMIIEINIECKELITLIENDHPSYTKCFFITGIFCAGQGTPKISIPLGKETG